MISGVDARIASGVSNTTVVGTIHVPLLQVAPISGGRVSVQALLCAAVEGTILAAAVVVNILVVTAPVGCDAAVVNAAAGVVVKGTAVITVVVVVDCGVGVVVAVIVVGGGVVTQSIVALVHV